LQKKFWKELINRLLQDNNNRLSLNHRVRCVILSITAILLLIKTDSLLTETPQKVTLCELKRDIGAYNHALLEVTGFVSHGFEDFSFFDPKCLASDPIWLEYGGKRNSDTVYCCGPVANGVRSKPLVVENVAIPLLDNANFQQFDKLLQSHSSVLLHTTLVGRFFSGEPNALSSSTSGGGYGHLGCCSLFVIQQVKSVDPIDRNDIDYDPEPDEPDNNKLDNGGCWLRDLSDSLSSDQWIAAQHKAEGMQPYAFDDPARVAAETLSHLTGAIAASDLKQIRQKQGRLVYEWSRKDKDLTYMITVSRPYLVTFYARDPMRIAWIAIGIFEYSCHSE
jgi:hypothetical protein